MTTPAPDQSVSPRKKRVGLGDESRASEGRLVSVSRAGAGAFEDEVVLEARADLEVLGADAHEAACV